MAEEALELYAIEGEWLGEVIVCGDNLHSGKWWEFNYDLPAKCIFQSDDENGWELAKETLERIRK